MKILTKEIYQKTFPDKANNYNMEKFEYICTLEFEFDDVQQFLNSKGYEMQIKEVRYKESYRNDNGTYYTGNDALRKVVVVVEEGTELPEILPYDGDIDINLTTMFRKLVSKQILGLLKTT